MGIIAQKLGKRIKELREHKKLSQQQLSEILNMESSNLSKIERGVQIPKEENLTKLASALDVSIGDLFDYEHFIDKDVLLTRINNILINSNKKKLQTIYKILINL